MRRAVFLDRDGVINERMPEGRYVTCWEEFKLLPGAAEAIRKLNDLGFLVVIVTNQRGIAKGLYTEEDLEEIHERMKREIERISGGRIDAIYYCPHERDENCPCRKPKPGMVLRAAEEMGIDLASSYLIGDSPTDIECGRAAGVGFNILISGEGDESCGADLVAKSLAEAVRFIEARESRLKEADPL